MNLLLWFKMWMFFLWTLPGFIGLDTGGGLSLSCSHSSLCKELPENVPQVIEQWPPFFPLTPPLSSPFSVGVRLEGGSSCHWLSRVCGGSLIGCRSSNSPRTKSGHSSSQRTVKSIHLRVKMSGTTRQSFTKRLLDTVLGLLCTHVYCELGVTQMGVRKEYCRGREEKLLISLADFLSFSWRMGIFSRFCGCCSDHHQWLCLCFSSGVGGMQVEQSPPDLILREGASSTLWCNFSISVNNVQWFRQIPGGRLINLFYIPTGSKWNGNLKATTVPTERRSSLLVSSAQTTDSAIYFCAVDPQCFAGTCSLNTNSQQGSSSPSHRSHTHRTDHHTAHAQLNIPIPPWKGFNHRYFLLFTFGIWVLIFPS